ncbi:hypothetical protein C7T94_16505 [Pedobacter yulinensis]|uniref:Uncharacterized protein n=1 Tax=Pedobacter yulinensis TaxID=2126353 RepID=A0A2T3HIW9_9SPHI|nr:hypothetical protein [Pedobacter yulinensis]PST82377.1 hypothetical protein C7T94_16505 [Pedobacter yulinensis]
MKKSNRLILGMILLLVISLLVFNLRYVQAYRMGEFAVHIPEYSNYWKRELDRVELPDFKHLIVNGAILETRNGKAIDSISRRQNWNPACLVSDREGKTNAVSILRGLRKHLRWTLRNDSLFITIEKTRLNKRAIRSRYWDASIFVEVQQLKSLKALNGNFRLHNLSSRDSLVINLANETNLDIESVRTPVLNLRAGNSCQINFLEIPAADAATSFPPRPAIHYSLGTKSSIRIPTVDQFGEIRSSDKIQKIASRTTTSVVLNRPEK